MPESVADISREFVVLDAQLKATQMPLTPTLYEQLDQQFAGFKGCALIACHSFNQDWPTWEIHPAGDEVVLLLEGSATLVLETADGLEEKMLDQPGQYLIVPRGVWHTAKIKASAKMLFITPGEGTENQVRKDNAPGS